MFTSVQNILKDKSVQSKLNRATLLSSLLIIDESTFDFADDLAEYIGEDPDSSGWERTVHLLIDSVFDKPFLFLEFFLIGENEEEDAQEIMTAVMNNSSISCWYIAYSSNASSLSDHKDEDS